MATSETNSTPTKRELVISYLLLRRLIGLLGISFPFVLALGTGLITWGAHWLEPSISHYYYSVMHVLFVGVLCLLCGFLVSYRGHHAFENNLSTLAGLFALGVAAFPTEFAGFTGFQYIELSVWPAWFNKVHYGNAALLFSCFAVFCFKIFHESDERKTPDQFDDKKKRRNAFYTFCGVVIVVSIALIGVIAIYENSTDSPPAVIRYSTIFFETTSLLAFGSSWLMKGTYDMPKLTGPLQRIINYYR